MGEVRTLRTLDNDESGGITLPKHDLDNAGLVREDGSVTEGHVVIKEEKPGEWFVRVLDV